MTSELGLQFAITNEVCNSLPAGNWILGLMLAVQEDKSGFFEGQAGGLGFSRSWLSTSPAMSGHFLSSINPPPPC